MIRFTIFVSLFTLISFLTGCGNNKHTQQQTGNEGSNYEVKYAKGFSVNRQNDYTEVTVHNPWDGSTQILHNYILVDKEKELPSNLPQGTIVRTPVGSALAYSAIHCSSLKEIGCLAVITGVCESKYINLEEIQERVANGSVIDVGTAGSPDIEKTIMLAPEVIFATPILGMTYGNIEKTRIPIIETIEYTEPDPLGQAEWVRFYSLFTGQEAMADSLFARTVDNYNGIKQLATERAMVKRPRILTDMMYMNVWNVPGGKSFMAKMLLDAGGDYVWSGNESETFLPLSFETVLDKGEDADYWLIKYHSPTDLTYETLKKEHKPYSYLKPFSQKNIYGCNTSKTRYYEDLPIHPDYILKDIAHILYPDLFHDYTPRYYQKLQ